MKRSVIFLFVVLTGGVILHSYNDLFAKQKAIHSVQNYRSGRNTIDFKSWLEGKIEPAVKSDIVWEAGRIRRGLWVVQISFQSETNEEHFLYLVDLASGRIRGADSGYSEETLKEFEESTPEFI
jgi:hypothetical protein